MCLLSKKPEVSARAQHLGTNGDERKAQAKSLSLMRQMKGRKAPSTRIRGVLRLNPPKLTISSVDDVVFGGVAVDAVGLASTLVCNSLYWSMSLLLCSKAL